MTNVRRTGHNPPLEVSALHEDPDCYVVEAAPLAQAVHAYAARRPHQATTAWLIEETGVPKWHIDNLLNRDPATHTARPRRRRIELRHADRIATAIGREDMLYTGELQPVANPAISQTGSGGRRTWEECCGGCVTSVEELARTVKARPQFQASPLRMVIVGSISFR